jgi:hypothetical protein
MRLFEAGRPRRNRRIFQQNCESTHPFAICANAKIRMNGQEKFSNPEILARP